MLYFINKKESPKGMPQKVFVYLFVSYQRWVMFISLFSSGYIIDTIFNG